ncbi:MAG: PhoH family protein [Proteobacteria bacterium]|nr:PhoH family protein [Pseudomonadota bacterium]
MQVLEIDFKDNSLAQALFGEHNSNLRLIEKIFPVEISAVGSRLQVEGIKEDLNQIHNLLQTLQELHKKGYKLTSFDIERAASILKENPSTRLEDIFDDKIYVSPRKKIITPKSLNQKRYIDAIRKHDIVFGIGPAGTGKTYLAMAMAVAALQKDEVRRIILTRPAVEAGEKLGFLPGDLMEKVNPYLRPLYDALNDMLELEKVKDYLAEDVIEVAPLAFMRGRTLNDSFVILDEAQNTTSEQMKMLLTRLGQKSKAVITGDVTQVDLPSDKVSGLIEGEKILKGIDGLAFVNFTDKDVVRHRLVQDIINAYDSKGKKKKRPS